MAKSTNKLANSVYPPTGFLFVVDLVDLPTQGETSPLSGFQEVSGIEVSVEEETIHEGGQNRFSHKIPGRVKYGNLELKRGLIGKKSAFGRWIVNYFSDGLNSMGNGNTKIEKHDVIVHLLDQQSKEPLMSWAFARAFPVKWNISNLNAKQSDLVVETLTLSFAYFVTIQPE